MKFIEDRKTYNALSDDQKALFDLKYDMHNSYHKKDFQALITNMIDA